MLTLQPIPMAVDTPLSHQLHKQLLKQTAGNSNPCLQMLSPSLIQSPDTAASQMLFPMPKQPLTATKTVVYARNVDIIYPFLSFVDNFFLSFDRITFLIALVYVLFL